MRILPSALFTVLFIAISLICRAQITVGTVDAGPYTPGSTIAATFSIGPACITRTNTFELYLSDATGDFTNEVRIGAYATFYSTFINGVIPATTTPGTGYRIRIKSTAPAFVSAASGPIVITAGTAAEARLTSLANTTLTTNPIVTFGSCNTDENNPNTIFRFTNASTAANVIVTIINEIDNGPPAILTFTSVNQALNYTASLSHFTMYVRAIMPDGTVSTRAYFLVNNIARTAFTTTGGNTVCFPTGAFEYLVNISAQDGIGRNFPGNTYHIDWGDGLFTDYSLCDITAAANRVGHIFSRSSCGLSYTSGTQTIYNAFGVNVGVISPFCGPIGSPLSTPARVVSRPENRFSFPAVACLNDIVTFANNSLPGQRSNTNSSGCADNNVFYTWYVDGTIVAQDVPLSYSLQYAFTTRGQHTIRLTSASDGGCQADVAENQICIQDPPAPSFTLPATTLCLSSGTLTPVNTSVIDNSCPAVAPPVYTWSVTPATGVSFVPGSITPTFTFTQTGIYDISLNISSATCNRTSAVQQVIVNSAPQISMSPEARLCTSGGTFTFGPAGGVTSTTVSGTSQVLPDTYSWTVTGSSSYAFTGTSTPNSQYPVITFSDYGTYTVTLVHQNNCGTETRSQTISFSPSPIPAISVAPTVCYNTPIQLQGTITNGTYTSFSWSSSGNGTFSDPASLTPIYTPSPADLSTLTATITLLVNTGIPGNCAQVTDVNTVNIFPNNTGTNTSAQICTGDPLSYTPSSTVGGSTFRWTAQNADGNAQPGSFSPSGQGNINETAIVNTNSTANAVIVYTITPESNGCDGVPYTFSVTVTPRPVLTPTLSATPICSNTFSGITLNSSLGASTLYSWTSSTTGGTITGASSQLTPVSRSVINDPLVNTSGIQGTIVYTITPYSANGCAGNPVNVTIQVDPALTLPNAGPDAEICNSGSFILAGNEISVGSGMWSVASGQTDVVFADATVRNTTVTGLRAGQNYIFRWTVSANSSCQPLSDDMTLAVNTPTVPGTTAPDDPAPVCANSNAGNIILSGYTGTVIRWQSSTDGGNSWTDLPNTNPSLAYQDLPVSTQFRAVVQNGQCAVDFSSVTTITVVPATTVANAGPDQTLCNEGNVQLNALSTLKPGETGLWTVSPASPNLVIADPTNASTGVSGLSSGQTYTFSWTITGTAPCGPTRDEVTVANLLPLTNTISSTATQVCFNQTVNIIGNTPTGGDGTYSYLWETSADGTNWNTITGQTGSRDLSYQLQATLSFRRAVISSACTSISNTITIIAQPPIGNNIIAADQEICTGLAPIPLTGSQPNGSDGNFNYQWQLSLNGGANWTDISGAVFLNYAPPVLTQTTLYRRIVSTITCNGNLSSISNVITINVKPNARAEFTYTSDRACTPFVIDANNIRAIAYPDRNATYSWYANDVLIGTGISFPGYTISASNTTVTIKLITTPSTGCLPDEMAHDFSTIQAVMASFTQSASNGCGPLIVNFVNTSSSLTAATFRWDFGNGVTSSQTMPAAVTYQADPTGRDTTYIVRLTAVTSCGENTISSSVLIKGQPRSVFSPSQTVGCSPMTVTFSNSSPGSSNTYYYDFGDGTLITRTDKSPVSHTFITNVVRDFVVRMVAENDCGRDESSYVIRVSPNTVLPELVVNANEKEGCAPFAVNFYNNSRGANVFRYDFGDGSTLITRSAPEVVRHTFTTSGTYTVTLTASNGCSDTTTTETINVLPQPATSFSANNTLGCPGLAVQFSNTSTDGVSYLWDFGDGSTSNEFAPIHVFDGSQEFYTISLTATNSLGCTATSTLNQYIHIVQPPVALFNVAPSTLISIPNYTFRFEDESTGSPAIWSWDFGDGTGSVLQNPSHTYADTGRYVVTLRVTNQQGCFTTTFKTVTIVGVPGYLYVPNSFMPGSPTPELRSFGAKGSGMKSWRMTVFNKWGQTLWETTTLNEGRPVEGWDGTFNGILQPQGVYFWKIDVEFINGSAWKGMTYDSSAPKKTGVIHLIR